MIRRGLCALRPILSQNRLLIKRTFPYPSLSPNQPLLSSARFFCSSKKNTQNDAKPEKDSANVQKEENDKKEEKTKLSEMSIEDLIEMNTQESLRMVEKKAEHLENENKKQKEQIERIEKQMTYFEKHHSDLTVKEEKLLENLNLQEEELARIKKRADREIENSKDFAITKIAKEIMEVADNIKRCQVFAEQKIKESPNDEFIKRIILSKEQMDKFLKMYDIEEFDPTGLPFDPNTSESLVTIPTPPGYTVNTVATTMQTGYKIKNRLLRSARVGIFV